jgi:hypothetical protein
VAKNGLAARGGAGRPGVPEVGACQQVMSVTAGGQGFVAPSECQCSVDLYLGASITPFSAF